MAFVELDAFLDRFVSLLPLRKTPEATKEEKLAEEESLLQLKRQLLDSISVTLQEEEDEEEEDGEEEMEDEEEAETTDEEEEDGEEEMEDEEVETTVDSPPLIQGVGSAATAVRRRRSERHDTAAALSLDDDTAAAGPVPTEDQAGVAGRQSKPTSPLKRKSSSKKPSESVEHDVSDKGFSTDGLILYDKFGNDLNSSSFCSWKRMVEPEVFKVRYPPNYKVNGIKKLSELPLYDVVACSGYQSPKKMEAIYQFIDFQQELFKQPKRDIPLVLGFHFLMPLYSPGFYAKDGLSTSICVYAVLNERGRRLSAMPKDKQPPSVRLMAAFMEAMKRADMKFAEKFKTFCVWENFEDMSEKISSMAVPIIRSYQGKPFLTRPQHKFWYNDKFLGCEFDGHIFGYSARLIWSNTRHLCPQMKLAMAVVIEGWGDEELPENILFQLRWSNANISEDFLKPLPAKYALPKESPPIFNELPLD
eukprot:g56432.t1